MTPLDERVLERFQGRLICTSGEGRFWWDGDPGTEYTTVEAVRAAIIKALRKRLPPEAEVD